MKLWRANPKIREEYGIEIYIYKFIHTISFKEVARVIVRMTRLYSIGKASRVVTQAGFPCYSPEAEFLLQETSVFVLKDSN